MTLLDSTHKKARFLQHCVDQLGLANVRVICERAETLGQRSSQRQSYDAVVCRAVGPMSPILEYTLPLTRVGGWVLAVKGPTVEQELEQASDALIALGAGQVDVIDAYPSQFNIHTVIVRVQKTRPTPKTYPRLPGIPRKEPL